MWNKIIAGNKDLCAELFSRSVSFSVEELKNNMQRENTRETLWDKKTSEFPTRELSGLRNEAGVTKYMQGRETEIYSEK